MQGSGTLDHKLVGKLQQLQQLYPSIVKLHQRKQVGSPCDSTLASMTRYLC